MPDCFSTGADLARLGEYYAKAIQSSAVNFDVIFGPAYKGIPIETSVSIALFNQFNVIHLFALIAKKRKITVKVVI